MGINGFGGISTLFDTLSTIAIWASALGAGLACLLLLVLLRQRGDGRGEEDLLARLYVMMEREGTARMADAQNQRGHLAEVERVLTSRIEQRHQDTSQGLGRIASIVSREMGEMRLSQSEALRMMAAESASQLEAIRSAVNERLHEAVERQMQTSFQRVLEQLAAMQKAMGEVSAMTAQVGDLKRLFSNVKTRGGWGEAQLRAILDDVLPEGAYEMNCRLSDKSRDVVEFAVRMPVKASVPPLLAIDSKFPTEAYERLLQAVEDVNPDAERAARRALETTLRIEARKIAAKYIQPPVTVEFAVLYLPTDGLYAEVARIPGLIDEIGRTSRVIIMGPGLMPAMLRTIHLGYVTLALEKRTDDIARLLGATRQEMLRMDDVLEKLARNASAMTNSIDEARRRTGIVTRQLRDLDTASFVGDMTEDPLCEATPPVAAPFE
ncbi:DNA recombination protein RmuC [Novacetimonas hansenii]|uniref:DNA recombination protein RmuC homolog n=1 Tax=Novacetimonas hansenii TaxID=436 RepID=A0AAW5EV82_NOVHA|nr:DNA recombination protein RmuC [Novacetimonas hansenii]MBL7236402.1 DNA recombination protein RmuC [Novacetimonas hansenii]MCJ8354235.1 DNA recombination protein RmuC [Novacetimonas hansenii]QOF95970.1 DNA recombination protein RmuC [Novacetimonas hansenii]RFP04731.1 DNA recombination protein RmuC [Novacetimonas hansenii]WEQ58890.1 DNA recombination protein RmuC [Novacetimonas hansenii]